MGNTTDKSMNTFVPPSQKRWGHMYPVGVTPMTPKSNRRRASFFSQ